jgi:hypothetical protein
MRAEGAALAALAGELATALHGDAAPGHEEVATLLEAVAALRFGPPEREP